jgi:arylsulfatase A-like enzyme
MAGTAKKPNILILWGDDIGIWNISKFSNGMMGYRTTNIDRVANEGVLFTDYYSQQSCTAGRACFIAGQNPIRTGLTKVGMPGARSAFKRKTQRSPSCSSLRVMPPASSARTTWATATNICQPSTASTNFLVTCIT